MLNIYDHQNTTLCWALSCMRDLSAGRNGAHSAKLGPDTIEE